MSERCKHVEKNGFNCGSYAFNLYKDGIDQGNLCDVHYWQAKALAQPEQDSTYTYASSLATAIWQKHYMKESPKWKPLDTTEGVLTQIDNMTCGLIKEKPAQPEQEPVQARTVHITWNADGIRTVNGVPDYTTPPQRTWVGLTDEEVKNLCLSIGTEPIEVRLIEAKLKERNG